MNHAHKQLGTWLCSMASVIAGLFAIGETSLIDIISQLEGILAPLLMIGLVSALVVTAFVLYFAWGRIWKTER